MKDRAKLREKIVESVKQRLLQNGFLRLQISLIFALTALSGFLTSFFLLQIEVYSMAFRYPFAIFVAYCVFLILLRIWLWLQKDDYSNFDVDLVDVSDIDISGISLPSIGSSTSSADADIELEGGGDFGGGGAGGSWSGGNVSSPASVDIANTSSTANVSSKSGSGGSSFLDGLDFDEGIWIILIIVALAGAFIAAIYVVYIAPVLFAEILIDGVLVTGLYARVKKIDKRYWLKTAVKKTLLSAFIIAVCFSVAGYGMQEIAPEARSIGEVWSYVLSD